MNHSSVWTRLEKSIDIGIKPTKKRLMHWNPSITWHKNDLWVSLRSYSLSEASFRGYTSPLIVGKLKDDKLVEYKEISPRNAPEYVKIGGIEDVRLWSDGKDLYGIGVVLDQFPNKKLDVHLAEIKIDFENGFYDVLRDFGQPYGHSEKNWSPIEGRPFEYMYSIDCFYNGKLNYTHSYAVNQKIIHNGTPLVKVGDGYISVVHQRTRLRDRTGCYPNRFIKYDKDLKPIEMTDWFVFKDYKDVEVQFFSGMVLLDKDTLGITVGLDRISSRTEALYKSLLYKVKLKDIDWQPYHPRLGLINGQYREGEK